MKYQAVIFDLDGVICNTDHYHYLAWKRIADEIGVYFDENINNRLRGVGRMQSLDIILEAHDVPLSEKEKLYWSETKNSIYKEYLNNLSPRDVSGEVLATLARLKGKGIKIAIGSSSKNARYILARLGLENVFDTVSDGNNISRSKPDPEVFLKASEYLGIEPRACLVVEDARSGIEAAIAAHMDCAAIGAGTACNMANYNLNSISELLLIKNLI